jgi:uncharacterized protein YbjQ (UPF0145 family)
MSEEEQPASGADPYRAGYEKTEKLIVTTGNDVEGHRIVGYLAIVRGIVVRSVGFAKGFVGAFRSFAAGNVKEYSELCEQARHEAFQQMIAHAEEVGADAIIGMRYDATEFGNGTTEVLAYGTAVRLIARND